MRAILLLAAALLLLPLAAPAPAACAPGRAGLAACVPHGSAWIGALVDAPAGVCAAAGREGGDPRSALGEFYAPPARYTAGAAGANLTDCLRYHYALNVLQMGEAWLFCSGADRARSMNPCVAEEELVAHAAACDAALGLPGNATRVARLLDYGAIDAGDCVRFRPRGAAPPTSGAPALRPPPHPAAALFLALLAAAAAARRA